MDIPKKKAGMMLINGLLLIMGALGIALQIDLISKPLNHHYNFQRLIDKINSTD